MILTYFIANIAADNILLQDDEKITEIKVLGIYCSVPIKIINDVYIHIEYV